MMVNAGKANVKITADDSQAQSTLKRFFGQLKKTGSIAAGVAGGIAIFEGIRDGLSSAKDATIGANAEMETYRNTLATVMKSNEKAVKTLAWAQKFASSTPFEIPDIVEATTRLEIYGLKAKDTLGTIGDMASVMGKPLMQAVEAIADAQTGELERLKEFGITKKMLIDKARKMYGVEIVNAQGQITDMKKLNGALFQIMEDRYKGGMKRASKTFKGLVSNAKDSFGTIARTLSRPIFEKFKSGLQSVVPIMSAVVSYFKGDAPAAVKTLTDAFGSEKAKKIIGFAKKVKNMATNVIDWFKSMKPAVDNFLQTIKNLAPVFKFVGGAIAVAFMAIATIIPPILNGITSILATVTGWKGFIPVIAGLAAAFGAYKLAMMAATTWTKLNLIWTKRQIIAQRALNLVLKLNPIGLIISLIMGLVVAFIVAYKRSETFRNIVNKAWASIKAMAMAVFKWFTVTVPKWVMGIVRWFQTLYNDAVKLFNRLWSKVQSIFNRLKNYVVRTIRNMKNIVMGIVDIFIGLFTGDFDRMRKGARRIIAALKDQVLNIFHNLFGGSMGLVKRLASGAIGKFWDLVHGIKNALSGLWDIITWPFRKAWKWIKDIPGKIKRLFASLKIHVPMPHFSFATHWKNLPGPLPSIPVPDIDIDWYKRGAVFPANMKRIIGIGDASVPEAALPLSRQVLGMIGEKIAATMQIGKESFLSPLINRPIVIQSVLNGRVIAQETYKDISDLQEKAEKRRQRARGE